MKLEEARGERGINICILLRGGEENGCDCGRRGRGLECHTYPERFRPEPEGQLVRAHAARLRPLRGEQAWMRAKMCSSYARRHRRRTSFSCYCFTMESIDSAGGRVPEERDNSSRICGQKTRPGSLDAGFCHGKRRCMAPHEGDAEFRRLLCFVSAAGSFELRGLEGRCVRAGVGMPRRPELRVLI